MSAASDSLLTAAPAVTSGNRSTRGWLGFPAFAIIGAFMGGPLLIVIVYSLLEPATYGGVVWNFSTDAYRQFLFEQDMFDPAIWTFQSAYIEILLRSFVLALAATAGCLIIGFPTAWFIATRPRRQRTVWLFLITIPYWTNLLIRTLSILLVLRDEGPVNQVLMALGILRTPLPLAYNDWAVEIGLIYSYLPFMVLPIFAAMERLDLRLLDAASDLYAGRAAILRHIIFPLSKGGVAAGCILVFIPSVGTYLAPDLLGGGKSMMIGNLIALQFQQSRNWPFGAALAVILLTIVLLILLAQAARSKPGRQRLHP